MSDHDTEATERLTNGAGEPPLHVAMVGSLVLVGALVKGPDETPMLSPVWELHRSITVEEQRGRLRVHTVCAPVGGLASLRVFPLMSAPSFLAPIDVFAAIEQRDIRAAVAKCEQIVRSILSDTSKPVEPPGRIVIPGRA